MRKRIRWWMVVWSISCLLTWVSCSTSTNESDLYTGKPSLGKPVTSSSDIKNNVRTSTFGFVSKKKSLDISSILSSFLLVKVTEANLQSQPKVLSKTLSTAKFGSTLTVLKKFNVNFAGKSKVSDIWYYVQTKDEKGWVKESSVKEFKNTNLEKAWISLLKDLSFSTSTEYEVCSSAIDFMTDSMGYFDDKPTSLLLFEFYRLVMVQNAVTRWFWDDERIPKPWVEKQVSRGLLNAVDRDSMAKVDYPTLILLLLKPTNEFFKLSDQLKNSNIGEDIAFYGATKSHVVECGGNIDCLLEQMLDLEGQFLKRYPEGRRVNEVVLQLTKRLTTVQEELENQPTYFDDGVLAKRSSEFIREIMPLVDQMVIPERSMIMAQLKTILVASSK